MVSCIMPTHDRRPFVGRAVAQFLAQDYPHRELIVLDDGTDRIADLIPDDPRIRLLRSERRLTIGAKRNLACEAARGDVVMHWDDDDWMAPWRIRYQLAELDASAADVCGLARLYFYDPGARLAWEYVYPDTLRGWLAGGTLCYRRALWQAHRFAEIDEGEDTRFVWNLRGVPLLALADHGFYVATIHRGNTSRKRTQERRYHPCPPEVVESVMRAGEGG
jgi:glycosyltransferase involved in cell wall biosynthesis